MQLDFFTIVFLVVACLVVGAVGGILGHRNNWSLVAKIVDGVKAKFKKS